MITLEQYAVVLAHLEHFPAGHHEEVFRRLRVSREQFQAASLAHGPGMASCASKGDTGSVVRFASSFRASKEALTASTPLVQDIAPLVEADITAEESTEDAQVEMPATVAAPTQLARSPEQGGSAAPLFVPTYLAASSGMQSAPPFVQAPDPSAPPPLDPDDTAPAILVQAAALPFSGRLSDAEAHARYAKPVGEPSIDAGATQLAPNPLARSVAAPVGAPAPGITGLMKLEDYARLCAMLAVRGENDVVTVRDFGLGTLQSKDAMHRLFALRFQTDPRMKAHFDRLFAEEIRRLSGG